MARELKKTQLKYAEISKRILGDLSHAQKLQRYVADYN
jgi:hypothetical protein